jgi:predicted metal-dependent peptidase
LSLHAAKVLTTAIPTAATDGYNVFLNPEFFLGLGTTKHRTGVLLHEVLHAALLHVTRRQQRDPLLWNYSADIVVNGLIDAAGAVYALPAGALRDAALAHLSVEEVYQHVLQQAATAPLTLDAGLRDLLAEPAARTGDAKEGRTADRPDRAGAAADADAGADADADVRQRTPEALRGYWRGVLERALTETALSRQAGTVPAGLERELGALTPGRLDWRHYLWRYLVRTPVDFAGYDRRFIGDGLYLDAVEGEALTVYVCVDTSGSIGPGELTAFVSEIRGILRSYPHVRCVLYYADAACYGPYEITDEGDLPPPQGHGGTDFRPFFRAVAQHVSPLDNAVTVYLTDGFGPFPTHAPPWPVLWVVHAGGADLQAFPFGETVRLLLSD